MANLDDLLCSVNFEAVERFAVLAVFLTLENCIWSPVFDTLLNLMSTPIGASPNCPFDGW